MIRNILFGAALLAAPAACNKDKTGKEADRSAERVNDNAKDLHDESRDVVETSADRRDELADTAKGNVDEVKKDLKEVARDMAKGTKEVEDKAIDNAKDVADESKDVGNKAMDLHDAQKDFEYARMVRIGTLRGVHAVFASQPMLINAIASAYPLKDADRAMVNEKLQIFQMRIDEAGNQIQALQTVEAATWAQRHDDVNKAMSRLEDAQKDVWNAVDDAERLDRTSMR